MKFTLLILVLLTGCGADKTTFGSKSHINEFGTPIRVEFYEKIKGTTFQFSDTPVFTITEPQEVNIAFNEIKNANNPEPWKGAGWDRVQICFSDTILKLNTDGTKIGTGASGTFYYLEKDNFITKHKQ
jgi:hypothetical protein